MSSFIKCWDVQDNLPYMVSLLSGNVIQDNLPYHVMYIYLRDSVLIEKLIYYDQDILRQDICNAQHSCMVLVFLWAKKI